MSDAQPSSAIMPRLSVMMFLQFFIWGAWYLTVSVYMIENQMEYNAYYAYTAGPLAAIIAPFFLGLFADRFMNTERVLGLSFFIGGLIMLTLPYFGSLAGTAVMHTVNGEDKVAYYTTEFLGQTWKKSNLFNTVIFIHMLCYMPSLGLTAAMSFHHLPKGSDQFPLVRLWGTLGWIAAGLVLGFGFTQTQVLADGSKQVTEAGKLPVQFYIGGGAAVLLGLYCFTLPKTPAPKRGQKIDIRDLLFLDAWKQLANPSFLIFIFCSFLVCIPLAAYYAKLQNQMVSMNMSHVSIWKNVGTWLEAGMMFMMPFFLRKLGVKWLIVIGIAAWAIRYALFSWSAGDGVIPNPGSDGYPGVTLNLFGAEFPIPFAHVGFWLMIGGIALHGICYDFFFVTGQIYVDRATPKDIRGQSQSMNVFFTQGLGLYLGAIVAGKIVEATFVNDAGEKVSEGAAESLTYWPALWWPLCGIAGLVMLAFIFLFREPKKDNAGDTA